MSLPEPEPSGTEARLRALVEAQSELVGLAQLDGNLVYVNPAWARHVGVEAHALIGRCLIDQMPDADRPAMQQLFDEVLAGGASRAAESRLRRRAGEEQRVAWTVGVQPDAGDTGQRLLHFVGRVSPDAEAPGGEALVRTLTDSLPLRIAYVDRELRYRFVNLAQCRRFGLSREQILGRTREQLLGRPTPAPIAERIDAVFAGQAQRFEYEETSGDTTHRIEVQLVPDVAPDGPVRGYFYTGLDVTDRARAEQALLAATREAQRQSDVLRLVTEAIPATVVVVGTDGRYRFANRAFEAYSGRPREQIIGRTAVEVLGAEEVARRRPFMARALAGESVSFALDYAGDEGTNWLELSCIPLRPSGGEVDAFVGISQDITQQRREQDRLTALSQREPLTGLLNRAGFELCLERAMQAGRGAALGLLYIDLDRFKPVNDRHGHLVGDHVLQRVAERLAGLVRPTDAVARLGGDEFAILLVDAGQQANAEAVAAKVVAAIGTPFEIDGLRLEIGASVGVAFGAPPQGGWRELIQRADAMLYRAKQSGRGRFAG